ncbi:hypothetical protein EQP59_07460 [Ornithobacterium rhinotracheale]|uniref:Uncharacterized protein n=1 Tax=Ornithobacterium rhinotracheale TaxID=28251 RepID=A0A410JSR2_ORNRH|nr:hypothetical protein [Ornithobacterium rhinotracheale]QAR31183.1 hypothetical protein EQP59_07460 [Ornithobacterium rhinotracheale]
MSELTANLIKSNNYERTDTANVSSNLIEAKDRRDTYEKWLTSSEYSKRTSESLRSLIEEGRRKNERGAPQGERAGTGDSESNGNESSRANRGGSERIRKRPAVAPPPLKKTKTEIPPPSEGFQNTKNQSKCPQKKKKKPLNLDR